MTMDITYAFVERRMSVNGLHASSRGQSLFLLHGYTHVCVHARTHTSVHART